MCTPYNATKMKGAVCPIVFNLLMYSEEKLNTKDVLFCVCFGVYGFMFTTEEVQFHN